MGSVIQTGRECYICRTTIGLHKHHLLHGTANRKIADRYGYWVYLCAMHHEEVHMDAKLDKEFKKIAQRHFEQTGTREDFRRVFGKSYLEDNDE